MNHVQYPREAWKAASAEALQELKNEQPRAAQPPAPAPRRNLFAQEGQRAADALDQFETTAALSIGRTPAEVRAIAVEQAVREVAKKNPTLPREFIDDLRKLLMGE